MHTRYSLARRALRFFAGSGAGSKLAYPPPKVAPVRNPPAAALSACACFEES